MGVTVGAEARGKSSGDATPPLTAVVTGAVAGGDAVNYTLATTAVTLSGVGSYPITVTLGSNPNYTVTKTDSTLTVTVERAHVWAPAKAATHMDAYACMKAVGHGAGPGGGAV